MLLSDNNKHILTTCSAVTKSSVRASLTFLQTDSHDLAQLAKPMVFSASVTARKYRSGLTTTHRWL